MNSVPVQCKSVPVPECHVIKKKKKKKKTVKVCQSQSDEKSVPVQRVVCQSDVKVTQSPNATSSREREITFGMMTNSEPVLSNTKRKKKVWPHRDYYSSHSSPRHEDI